MSPAEIEKLKARLFPNTDPSHAAIPRLLEERERLLEALEELLRLGERFGPAAADRAQAALAFATAPAGKEEK